MNQHVKNTSSEHIVPAPAKLAGLLARLQSPQRLACRWQPNTETRRLECHWELAPREIMAR
jgi:hypothetical protein